MIDYQISDVLTRKQEGDDQVLQALWDLLDKAPIVALNKMLETSDGRRWMADGWDVIAGHLDEGKPLGPILQELGIRLLGGSLHGPLVWEFELLCEVYAATDRREAFAKWMANRDTPPSLRKKYPELPFRDVWMSRLKAIVEEKRSKLRQREAGLRDQVEPAALARILPTYLCLADERDSTKYHRYHRDAFSTLLRGIKALKDCVPGDACEFPPPDPEPEDFELAKDADVHAGFDESEDVGPVYIPGYDDPLLRNEPDNPARYDTNQAYANPAGGPLGQRGGRGVNAGSRPERLKEPGLGWRAALGTCRQ
jgi:hypothetical protein